MEENNASVIVDAITKDWLGAVGGVLAILGVIAAPITSVSYTHLPTDVPVQNVFALAIDEYRILFTHDPEYNRGNPAYVWYEHGEIHQCQISIFRQSHRKYGCRSVSYTHLGTGRHFGRDPNRTGQCLCRALCAECGP